MNINALQHKILLVAGLCLILVMSSCGGTGQQLERKFDDKGWRYADSLVFPIDNADTSSARQLRVQLELNDNYPYSNLYLKFRVKTPKGQQSQSLTEFILSDPLGNWNVDKSWFGGYKFEQVLVKNIRLQETGQYEIHIAQFMRNDTLPGVSRVSFILEPMSTEP